MPLLAMRVKRGDDRSGGLSQGEPWHERHQRFVHVQDVEAFRPKQLRHPPSRSRIHTDAGFGAADECGAANGDARPVVRAGAIISSSDPSR